MGPRCLFQKSVVGVKGNNICGVSWLQTQHTLGTLPMCIQYSLQTLFHSHLPPLEVLYASVRDQQASSKYFQKQAAYNFLKHSVLEVGRPHLPGIIVCPDDTRYGEDRRRRHRPSQGGDSSALETGLSKEEFKSSPRYITFKNRNGRQWRLGRLSVPTSASTLSIPRRS